MKNAIAILLVLCVSLGLCLGLCACNAEGQNTAGNVHLSTGQADAVVKVAKAHAVIDFGYQFDSITYETVEDNGDYVTVTGVVVFKDSDGSKYHGNYDVVLAATEDPDSYVLKSWKLDELFTEDGTAVDFYDKLYQYIIQYGRYDSTDKVSYISTKGSASNEELFLIAENGTLHYSFSVYYKTSSKSFMLFYDCYFEKGTLPRFEFNYLKVDEYINGVAIRGQSAKITGRYKDCLGLNMTIDSEDYIECDKNSMKPVISDCHSSGIDFIEDIMTDAKIPGSFETLFGKYIASN